MLDEQAFSQLVDEIKEQGIDEGTACRYAALIGDTPIGDDQGKIVVMNDGRLLARLEPLKIFIS